MTKRLWDEIYMRCLAIYLAKGFSIETAREMASADADLQRDKDEELREGDWTR